MIPISTVTLTNDENFKKMIEKFASMMAQNQESMQLGSTTWMEQIRNSMKMPEPDEDEENTCMDFILHFLSFYWKGI